MLLNSIINKTTTFRNGFRSFLRVFSRILVRKTMLLKLAQFKTWIKSTSLKKKKRIEAKAECTLSSKLRKS